MTGTATTARRGLRTGALALLSVLLLGGCNVRHVYESSLRLGFPHPITDEGKRIYDLWIGSVLAAAVVGIVVWGLIFYAIIRFRKTSDDIPRQVRYNLPVEVLYTVVPFVIVVVLFYYTAVGENYVDRLSAKPDVTIGVVGFKWNWQFDYLDAGVQVTGSITQTPQLVLPVGERIRFVETSPDVIHSWFVPNFLFKRDVIPGRINQFEVTIRQTGTFLGRCAEFCGEKHSKMDFSVRVVSPDEYAAYIKGLQADPTAALTPNTEIATGLDTVTGYRSTTGSSS